MAGNADRKRLVYGLGMVNWQEAAQASSSSYDAAWMPLTVTFMTTLLDGQSKQVLSHIKVLETTPSQHHAIHSELILMSLSFLKCTTNTYFYTALCQRAFKEIWTKDNIINVIIVNLLRFLASQQPWALQTHISMYGHVV